MPSAWVQRHAHLLPAGGAVLDLACGSGRHLRWLAGRGFKLTGVDRDAAALALLAAGHPTAELLVADLEGGPWPLPGRHFDGIVVTNYLWRPLWPDILAALAPGGTLVCETFADGQQHIGRPSRPDFLLRHGELLQVCAGLHIVAYEDGHEAGPGHGAPEGTEGGAAAGRCVQRIVAVHQPAGTPARRHELAGPGS